MYSLALFSSIDAHLERTDIIEVRQFSFDYSKLSFASMECLLSNKLNDYSFFDRASLAVR